jgi:hypothetical protein
MCGGFGVALGVVGWVGRGLWMVDEGREGRGDQGGQGIVSGGGEGSDDAWRL